MAPTILSLVAEPELLSAERALARLAARASVMTDAELQADYVTLGSLEDAAQWYQFQAQSLGCVAIGASQLRIARAIRAMLASQS